MEIPPKPEALLEIALNVTHRQKLIASSDGLSAYGL